MGASRPRSDCSTRREPGRGAHAGTSILQVSPAPGLQVQGLVRPGSTPCLQRIHRGVRPKAIPSGDGTVLEEGQPTGAEVVEQRPRQLRAHRPEGAAASPMTFRSQRRSISELRSRQWTPLRPGSRASSVPGLGPRCGLGSMSGAPSVQFVDARALVATTWHQVPKMKGLGDGNRPAAARLALGGVPRRPRPISPMWPWSCSPPTGSARSASTTSRWRPGSPAHAVPLLPPRTRSRGAISTPI